MGKKEDTVKHYKIFSDLNITIKNSKDPSIPGVAYKISMHELGFVADLKISHGTTCLVSFKEAKIEPRTLMGNIKISRTINSAYGLNKYTLQFENPLKQEDLNRLVSIYIIH